MDGDKDKCSYFINQHRYSLIPRAQSLKNGSTYPALPYHIRAVLELKWMYRLSQKKLQSDFPHQ